MVEKVIHHASGNYNLSRYFPNFIPTRYLNHYGHSFSSFIPTIQPLFSIYM
jgi:hypothetical protein